MRTSSTSLCCLACCHGYPVGILPIYLSQRASARMQQARDEVGMRCPIAHGCAARRGRTRILSTLDATLPLVLHLIPRPVYLFCYIQPTARVIEWQCNIKCTNVTSAWCTFQMSFRRFVFPVSHE